MALRFTFSWILFLQFTNLSFGNSLDSAYYYDQKSNYHKSELFFADWVEVNRSYQDSTLVEVLLDYGRAQRINVNLIEGLASVNEALELAQKLKSNYLVLKCQIQKGDYLRAINKLQMSKNEFQKIDRETVKKYPILHNQYLHRKAATYNEMSWFENMNPHLDTAISLCFQAIKVSRKNKLNKNTLATSFNELATIYEKLMDHEKAIAYYDSSCSVFKNTSLIDYINAYFNKSRVLFTIKDYNQAILNLTELTKLIEGKNWYSKAYPIYHHLYECYWAIGDTLRAYEAKIQDKENFILHREKEVQKELSKLQVEFDVSNKEKELSVKTLQFEAAERTNTIFFIASAVLGILILLIGYLYFTVQKNNKRLKELLEENAFLMGEANHRIKNNLQLIVSLLARETRNADEESMRKLMGIKTKIESIATLHQQLYLNSDKTTVDLKQYIEEVVENFDSFLKENDVECKVNLEKIEVQIEKSLYAGLLVTELMINSLKHAFESIKKKEISIDISQNNSECTLKYSDNGNGLPENKKPALINLLSKQLKAKILMENKNGFHFHAKFNL